MGAIAQNIVSMGNKPDDRSRVEIHQLLSDYQRAVKLKDLDRLMSLHTSDVVSFDLMMPFQNDGVASMRERTADWFSSYATGIDWKFENVAITVQHGLAVCHLLVHSTGTLTDGEDADMWMRASYALRKDEDDRWKFFHVHMSDPIDMETMTAVFQPR